MQQIVTASQCSGCNGGRAAGVLPAPTPPEASMRKLLPTVIATLLAVAACSSGGGDQSSESAAGVAAPQVAAAGDTAEAAGGGTTAGNEALSVTDLRAAPGLAVIRTAELEVRVDDVRAAADEAARVARTAGGGVEAEQRSGSGEDGSATVQLRVPPKAFDDTIRALSALGDERGRRLSSEDVTDQVVDLEARLATQRASVERVRALLGEADALGEVVQIESELTRRTADLEALQARLESLTARVDLSTIVLRLDGTGRPAVGEALGFGDGLRGGWDALVTTARVVAVAAGALLPFLPLLLVGGYLALRARNRRTAAVVQT
jgi:hypothetical protein